MKAKIALLTATLLVFAPTLHSADKNAADYPIKFVILDTHTDTNLRWANTHGAGRGRINDGGQVSGVEFQYECDERLRVAYGGEFLAAKWKKPGEEITVISQDMGSDHMSTCDVKVSVHDFVYFNKNGHVATMSQQQWAARHAKGEHQPEDDAPPAPPQN